MKWQHKAMFMRACARLPKGAAVYQLAQKRFGRLTSNPTARIPDQIKLANWLRKKGFEIQDRVFLEVGTGHLPIIPIGLFLSGARSVITMDLHRRLDEGLLRETLDYFTEKRAEIEPLYSGLATSADLDQRFDVVRRLRHAPKD